MKKMSFFAIVLFSVVTLTACGASKNVSQNNSQKSGSNPFGATYEMPCQVYDTPQEFAATSSYRGSKNKMDEVHWNALRQAQNLIKVKMQRAYEGMFSEYANSYGNNKGNDIEDKMERACDNALSGILNNTSEFCTRWGEVDEDGHLYCFIGIKISKDELASKSAQEVKKLLTEEEKIKIDFKEEEFRQKLDGRFEKFKEEQGK